MDEKHISPRDLHRNRDLNDLILETWTKEDQIRGLLEQLRHLHLTLNERNWMDRFVATDEGFHGHGSTQNGGFMMQNPIEMEDVGVPPFVEPPKRCQWMSMASRL